MRQLHLKDACDYISRGVTPLYSETGICILNQKCIRDNKVSLDKAQFTSNDKRYPKEKYIRANDILINSTGTGTLGRVAFYNGTSLALCDSHITIVRLLNQLIDGTHLSPKYINYYLHLNETAIEALGRGATNQTELSGKDIGKINIYLPAEATQKKIVTILSAYDNLIEVNNKRIKVLEQMAENLYKEWFVRFRFPGHEIAEFESGIPKGWVVKKVRDIVKRLPFGTLYKTEETEPEGKVIVIDQSQDEYVGFHNNEPSHIASPLKPVILFGDHSCKYQLMITPFSLSENVIPFVGNDSILTTYLFYLIYGIVETTEYKRHWTELVAKKVLVAPSNLQKCFTEYISPISIARQKLKEENRKLMKQRDLLLPRLMTGKMAIDTEGKTDG